MWNDCKRIAAQWARRRGRQTPPRPQLCVRATYYGAPAGMVQRSGHCRGRAFAPENCVPATRYAWPVHPALPEPARAPLRACDQRQLGSLITRSMIEHNLLNLCTTR